MGLKRMSWCWCYIVLGLGVAMSWAGSQTDEPDEPAERKSNESTVRDRANAVSPDSGAAEKGDEEAIPRLSLEAARDRARLMHDIYAATLDAIHHRYFHGDRAVVPARAMEDVFRDMEWRTNTKSRWIGASFAPMSITHEPKTDFEKVAAHKIARGEEAVETIEEGYYRRAGSISLNQGCVSCHGGLFAANSTTPKFAGLIISIPVDKQARLEADDASSGRQKALQ
ncbi:MAG: DUF3365 domain-containing protein [Pirellulaceae bacterium]